MKKILKVLLISSIWFFYILNNCFGQELDTTLFSIGDINCPNNLVLNPSFSEGVIGNISRESVPHWKAAYKDPIYSKSVKDSIDNNFVSMWGNLAIGEGLYQELPTPFQAGKQYQVALTVQAKQINERPNYVRIKVRASNQIPNSPNCTPEYCSIVGISRVVSTTEGWTRIKFSPWTALKGFKYLIISPENGFNINDGEQTSTAWIDDICVYEFSKPNILPIILSEPFDNELVNPNIERTLNFEWKGPTQGINYKLNIYELSREDTVISNLVGREPVFTQIVEEKNSYTLELSQLPFKQGQAFIWNVQAIDSSKEPVCPDGCFSLPHSFTIIPTDCGIDLESYQIDCKASPYQNGKMLYEGCISFKNTSQSSSLSFNDSQSDLFLYDNAANPIAGLTLTSNFPTNLSPNSSATVCFEISLPLATKTINLQVVADDTDPSQLGECIPKDFVTATLPLCKCDDCQTIVNINGVQSIYNIISSPHPNIDYLNIRTGLMSSTPVIRMQAEIVYFDLTHTDAQCKTCVLSDHSMASFDNIQGQNIIMNHPSNPNATSGFTSINGEFMGSFSTLISKMLQWESTSAAGIDISTGPINFDLLVAVPKLNTLSCCTTNMEICIRYTLTDENCRVCNKLLCSSRNFVGTDGNGGHGGNGSGSGGNSNSN